MANQGLVRPNPALERGFANPDVRRKAATATATMTINGTVHATAVFLFVLIAVAALSYGRVGTGIGLIAILAAFAIGLYTSFRPQKAQYTGLAYAVLEGVGVGVISKVYEDQFKGIILQAAGLTVCILAIMLVIYRTRMIKVTQNFRIAVSAAVTGVALFYLVDIGLGLFGVNVPLVSSNSGFGILFSVAVVCLAAATLVVDFDFIERGVDEGLPKNMEWYGAFGLMVSIVWLYLELLRLLSKLQSR